MEDPFKRALRKDFSNNCSADFVTKNTRHFFPNMKIDQKCSMKDPGSWNEQPGYLIARKLVQGIQVTDDTAERWTALI